MTEEGQKPVGEQTRGGQRPIGEGWVRKGGLNNAPTSPRPPLPPPIPSANTTVEQKPKSDK